MYESEIVDNPFLLVDLGQLVKIRSVSFRAKGNVRDKLVNDFEQLSVRIGSVEKLGDFTSYKEIGYFAGPGYTQAVASFAVNPPLTGRYVSIQRMQSSKNLAIGYFNVYIEWFTFVVCISTKIMHQFCYGHCIINGWKLSWRFRSGFSWAMHVRRNSFWNNKKQTNGERGTIYFAVDGISIDAYWNSKFV